MQKIGRKNNNLLYHVNDAHSEHALVAPVKTVKKYVTFITK